jgi:hypothetical protein
MVELVADRRSDGMYGLIFPSRSVHRHVQFPRWVLLELNSCSLIDIKEEFQRRLKLHSRFQYALIHIWRALHAAQNASLNLCLENCTSHVLAENFNDNDRLAHADAEPLALLG